MEYISHATLIVSEDCDVNANKARTIANQLLGLSENDTNIHSDLVIIGDEKTDYSINNIREIRKTAFYSPVAAGCKIYIFKNIEDMPVPSQNALLKIIEEPPDNVYFIFTATSTGAILPTVLSRITIIKQNIECKVDLSDEAKGIISLINEGKEFDINCKFSEYKTRDDLILLLQEIRIGFLINRRKEAIDVIDFGIDSLKKNVNQSTLISVLSHKLIKETK